MLCMELVLITLDKADSATCGGAIGIDSDRALAYVDDVSIGAVDVAGCPILTISSNFADGATNTFASCGQEDGTSGFKNSPLFGRIRVGGVGVAGSEVDASRSGPSVG